MFITPRPRPDTDPEPEPIAASPADNVCRYCGAAPGEPCRTYTNRELATYHQSRHPMNGDTE